MPVNGFRIAGAGLVALDVVMCEDRLPPALTFAGGTCGNVLAILSYLRWNSTVVGFVGDDEAGSRVLADLISVGVRAEYLLRDSAGHTPVFVQTIRKDKAGRPRHTFSSVCPGCGQELEGVKPTMRPSIPLSRFTVQDAPNVFFIDRLSAEIVVLAESAKTNGSLVFYEPSVKSDSVYWQDIFPLVDIIKYSADRFDEREFADVVLSTDEKPLWEIQTLGVSGLRFRKHAGAEKAGWTTSPAISAPRVVDTCGAGDWCSAGLLQGLVDSKSAVSDELFAEAIRLGQAFAAWACAFVGARGAMYCQDADSTWDSVRRLLEGRSVDVSALAPRKDSDVEAIRQLPTFFAGLCSGGIYRGN